IVEHDVERRGMRLEQEVGRERRLDLVGREIGETWLRMWPVIGVRPAVEAAFLYPDQVVGGQLVAEPVTLLYDGPEFARLRVKGEGRRVAHPRRVGLLVPAVGIEALNRGLRLGLDAEIAGRPDTHEECTCLWIDREVPILVPGRHTEDALLGEELGPIGA